MTENVETEPLPEVCQNYNEDLTTLRVFLFCMKYPKLRFTTECLAVNQGTDKVVLEKEIEHLTREGILAKGNDGGITYYYLNTTQRELTELTEGFLRDRHLRRIENKS